MPSHPPLTVPVSVDVETRIHPPRHSQAPAAGASATGAALLRAVADELERRGPQIESTDGLTSVSIIISLYPRTRRVRRVSFRTESESDLGAGMPEK